MIRIVLKSQIPSGNVSQHEHWAPKRKRTQALKEEITMYMLENYKQADRKAAQSQVRKLVHIHSQRVQRLDYDNLTFGAKALLDVFKPVWGRGGRSKGFPGMNYIVEDNPDWVKVLYTQDTGGEHFTEIRIYEEHEDLPC